MFSSTNGKEFGSLSIPISPAEHIQGSYQQRKGINMEPRFSSLDFIVIKVLYIYIYIHIFTIFIVNLLLSA